jgi:hypothetical protein
MLIAASSVMMEIICEHCQAATTGKLYRVTSEEGAVVMLDMIVCEACCQEAQKLGLNTNQLDSIKQPVLERK